MVSSLAVKWDFTLTGITVSTTLDSYPPIPVKLANIHASLSQSAFSHHGNFSIEGNIGNMTLIIPAVCTVIVKGETRCVQMKNPPFLSFSFYEQMLPSLILPRNPLLLLLLSWEYYTCYICMCCYVACTLCDAVSVVLQ